MARVKRRSKSPPDTVVTLYARHAPFGARPNRGGGWPGHCLPGRLLERAGQLHAWRNDDHCLQQYRTRLTGRLPSIMTAWALLLAAGSGSRMGTAIDRPKQFLQWRARPLYWHSAMTFSRSACIDGIVFVFPQTELETEKERIAELAQEDSFGLPWLVSAGGVRRQDSCKNGLALVPMTVERVLVHDAARPFMSAALARRVCDAVSSELPCIVPAVPVTDTTRQLKLDGSWLVERTLERQSLVACQTPQGFWAEALRKAISEYGYLDVTDEAALMEKLGHKVGIVCGEAENTKITNTGDLKLLHEEQMPRLPCNGFGYDVHRYGPGRKLILGGVLIPGSWQVQAHSDGDVLLHALMDALLGMAAQGDIGRHFPDTDPMLDGISSPVLLDRVLEMLAVAKIEICHADLTVVAQKPRLAPYAEEIHRNVARLLGLNISQVNFKATTEEKLGFTGNCEGIKAYALTSGLRKA